MALPWDAELMATISLARWWMTLGLLGLDKVTITRYRTVYKRIPKDDADGGKHPRSGQVTDCSY